VADVELVQVRDGADLGDVDVVDPMSGIDREPAFLAERGADTEALELRRAARRVAGLA